MKDLIEMARLALAFAILCIGFAILLLIEASPIIIAFVVLRWLGVL